MAKILIPTYNPDIHATAVEWALGVKGQKCVRWCVNDFPTRLRGSITVGNASKLKTDIYGANLEHGDLERGCDVVWLRRPVPPYLPDGMHPGDKIIAERECREFLRGVLHTVAPDAFWVNSMTSYARAESKIFQLSLARGCGFSLPKTLISNDAAAIRQFIRDNRSPTVYKPFAQSVWHTETTMTATWVKEITEDKIPDDPIMSPTPGIFQEKVEKAYELRITVMGRHVVAAKLDSQNSEGTRDDWRARVGENRIEPVTLPQAVPDSCIALLGRMGLVFGCFDLIVTPRGEYVFLEVNQMGQFLWLDELCPDFNLLDDFTEFLISGNAAYEGQRRYPQVRFSDYLRDEAHLVDERNEKLHVTHAYAWDVAD
jgi:hypothetical protein